MFQKGKTILARFFFLLFLAAIFVLSSCQQEEVCEEAANNPLRVGFYQLENDSSSQTTVNSISVYGVGKPNDMIYENQSNVGLIEVPLDPSQDSCGFVLDFRQGNDTLWVNYERDTHLVSVECGFVVYYSLQNSSVTNNYVLAIEVTNPEITSTADEHLKIYIPADDGVIPGN